MYLSFSLMCVWYVCTCVCMQVYEYVSPSLYCPSFSVCVYVCVHKHMRTCRGILPDQDSDHRNEKQSLAANLLNINKIDIHI